MKDKSIIDVIKLISIISDHGNVKYSQRNHDKTAVDLVDFVHIQFLHSTILLMAESLCRALVNVKLSREH
jgi:hypothetical protein